MFRPIVALIYISILLIPFAGFVVAIMAYRRAGRVEERLNALRASLRAGASLLKEGSGLLENREATPVSPAKPIPSSLARDARADQRAQDVSEMIRPAPIAPAAAAPPPLKETTAPESDPWAGPLKPATTAPTLSVPTPVIDWEKFTAVKLMSWVGGFALFLGALFFAKYSIDHGWVSPAFRVAMGLALGTAAVLAGIRMRPRYEVTGQTLAASGAAILYGVTFAAHARYGFIGSAETFLFLSFVTVLAFFLSARMNSQYIAILALAGGFLVPPLVSTGVDQPLGLFAYVTLLDLGLLALVSVKGWGFLWGFAATGTVLMISGWWGKFFVPAKMPTATAILLWFPALFAGARAWMAGRQTDNRWILNAAGAIPLVSILFAMASLFHASVAQSPGAAFAVLFGADVVAAWLAVRWPETQRYHLGAGLLIFLTLYVWTSESLTAQNLPLALGAYLAFGGLHGALSLVLNRRGAPKGVVVAGHLFPVVLLLPLTIGLLKNVGSPMLVWPVMFGLNIIALVAALATGLFWAALGALALTFVAALAWIPRVAADGLPGLLVVIAGMAGVFFAAGYVALTKRSKEPPSAGASEAGVTPWTWPAPWNTVLPALSGILPFFLLATAAVRLRPSDPSSLFGLVALLLVLLLGLVRSAGPSVEALGPVALGGAALVQYAWHGAAFSSANPFVPLCWYMAFFAVFLFLPFLQPGRFGRYRLLWVTSALSGPIHFRLFYRSALALGLSSHIGALPVAESLVALAALWGAVRSVPEGPHRRGLLALFGGVALFFITLIFPLQFEKQWITLGWALEGVALLWLHRRIAHKGLRLWAIGLLIAAFTRLALNPAVLSYHPRAETPLVNWYFYAFGLTAACLFLAAKIWPSDHENEKPDSLIVLTQAPNILRSLGTVLLFLLMNIEITDYFSQGEIIRFSLNGPVAQDLAYTLGWGLFGLGLLVVGLLKKISPARKSALALLAVTVGKLFFHDIWRLPVLHRALAFGGTAVLLILGAFLYQKFQSASKEVNP